MTSKKPVWLGTSYLLREGGGGFYKTVGVGKFYPYRTGGGGMLKGGGGLLGK